MRSAAKLVKEICEIWPRDDSESESDLAFDTCTDLIMARLKETIAALDEAPDLDQACSEQLVRVLMPVEDCFPWFGDGGPVIDLAKTFGRRCSNLSPHMSKLVDAACKTTGKHATVAFVAWSEILARDNVVLNGCSCEALVKGASIYIRDWVLRPEWICYAYVDALIGACRVLGGFGKSEQEALLEYHLYQNVRIWQMPLVKKEAEAALSRIRSRHDQQTSPVTMGAESSKAATDLLHSLQGQDDVPLVVESQIEVESQLVRLHGMKDTEALTLKAPSLAEAESITDPVAEQQRDLQETLMRRKADWPVPICHDDSVVILRLTHCCKDVTHALRASSALGEARKRVEEAGCILFPNGSNGALLLVPLTSEQVLELGLQLENYHVVALRSDKPAIDEVLRMVPHGLGPRLRDDHRAEFAEAEDPLEVQAAKSDAVQEMELFRPQVHEIAQLHPRVLELILRNVGNINISKVTVSVA
eukprot:CAMPEP_0172769094 /NCGR_PEP_ID=MMETSP1074-20121228/185984_1 /TAXON_ID=2916 /ORGANISM="Ceratium fusus, Strain PA161109" /LENGTH=474 /DNA_ID=CAMNT_0013604603 /DNA_START=1 /DNA_END=1425 /DNA_ORIENTATION=-